MAAEKTKTKTTKKPAARRKATAKAKARTKVLVTGARGFVGQHLVDAVVARGDDVTATDLPGEPLRDDVPFVGADIRDKDAMDALFEGVEAVFHSASLVHTKRNQEHTVWSVNLEGTRNVLAACRKHGVKRLIYVSTASAVYEGRDIRDGDETMPYSTISQAPYADSKIAAEKLVLAADGQGGLRTCAIRPHVVFGPGDGRFLPAILERAKAGKLRLAVATGDKLSDFTYVTNLIDALLAADERLDDADSAVGGEAFFITNGEPMPFFDFVERVLADLSLPRILGRVPYPIAYAAAAAREWIDTRRGGTLNSEATLSKFAVKYLGTHHYFSIDKARTRLGYQPQVSVDEGIRRTVADLRQRGWA